MRLTRLKVPRKALLRDMISGMVMALVSIPGGLANGLLAGVNPIFGLYSIMAGTTVGALFTSSVLMNIDSTGATALATLEAMSGIPSDQHLGYLVVLGLMVGLFMLVFGLLKLGFLVRFVSNAVMTGFLSGLGVLTILAQVGDMTGYSSEVRNKVLRSIDTVIHWRGIDLPSLVIGFLTIIIILAVNRTRFKKFSFLVPVLLTTLVVALLHPETVALVGDTASIPRSLPSLHLPDASIVLSLLPAALSIAIIALVQAAGVSGSVPNPDGAYPDPSGDFRGQGVANLAVGLVGGIPVGGSISGTFLIQSVGGRSRWANIFTGLFTALAILLIAPLIELIPTPTLAGLLMLVGFSMIKIPRIQTVWQTGVIPFAVMLITFIATLAVSISVAVALGVVLHIVIHIFRSAGAVRLERIVQQADGSFAEAELPNVLPSGEIVILQPVGSLFFAGVAGLAEKLPDVAGATGSVVILRLRDRDEVGSTFIRAIRHYARALHAEGNVLMIEGVNQKVLEQLERTDLLDLIGKEHIFMGQPTFGAALREALSSAAEWIKRDEGSVRFDDSL